MLPNHFPWWKNLLVIVVILTALLYALPNLYGTDPAVQISAAETASAPPADTVTTINNTLEKAGIVPIRSDADDRSLLLRFASTDQQFQAREVLQEALGKGWLVALNLAPSTPAWLQAIGANPMKLGLDLRGGLHFLLQVDVDSVLRQRSEGNLSEIGATLRKEHIRYTALSRGESGAIQITLRDRDAQNAADRLLSSRFSVFEWTPVAGSLTLKGVLSPAALEQVRRETLEQAMNTLRNEVNELGVTEAIVQQQGASRITIDLPGIQDTAEAEKILGKTATLEFHMVNTDDATTTGTTSFPYNNRTVQLQNRVILHGSSITSASASASEDGRPAVNVRLGGTGDSLFSRTTAENIGKPMAVLYVEVKPTITLKDGKKDITYETHRRVISVATIQSALGNSFEITGLSSPEEARTLALLLRAGALPAPVAVIESRQVGPNLGKQNIRMGIVSVEVGFALVVLFMALYYGVMGLIADAALLANLVLIVAILSLLGGTLTLPGIAGIVLTMGMAVDANVLIFERIREELRNGAGIQAAIYAGYDRAFMTIVDANLTTLIVAVVLFSLGSGTVKNFAVTLTIGLVTSMFTAITGTRAIVNQLYGRRTVKKISIGI